MLGADGAQPVAAIAQVVYAATPLIARAAVAAITYAGSNVRSGALPRRGIGSGHPPCRPSKFAAMAVITGKHDGDLRVEPSPDGPVVIAGLVVGNVTVPEGAQLILGGQVTKDLWVLPGGSAEVRGQVVGRLLVAGTAEVFGTVLGEAIQEPGGTLTLHPGARLNH